MAEKDHDGPDLRGVLRRCWRLAFLARGYWRPIGNGVLISAIGATFGLVAPYVSKLLIDQAYPSRDFGLAYVLIGGLVSAGVATAVMGALSLYVTQHVNARLTQGVSLVLFNHLQHLPLRFFERHRTGEVTSRFADARTSLTMMSQIVNTVFFQGIYLVLVPPFLIWLEWRLALVALVTLPMTTAAVGVAGRSLRKRWKLSSEAQANLTALHVEVLSHARQLKAMGLEPEILRRATRETGAALDAQLRACRTEASINGLTSILQVLGSSLVALVGWRLILRGGMTLGAYIAFTGYLGYLAAPLMRIAQLFSTFQQSAVHIWRMFEYLDESPEQDPSEAYTERPRPAFTRPPRLTLRDVSFGYARDRPVLSGVDMVFDEGAITVIMGPSGAGKSTLLRLLTRLEDPDRGSIACDGRPVASYSLQGYRRSLAVVWQDVALLRGSVWENITMGRSDIHMSTVEEATQTCALHEWVHMLPSGYDTPIAEWGASISGGQKQRLALARALVQDAPVLILDEATSNVDGPTEKHILDGVLKWYANRTVICVTHRSSMAHRAGRVYLIERGGVRAQGTHPELMRADLWYRELHGSHPTVNFETSLGAVGE
jgi:ABC-type bacteriocin/lantibiotic exporter with double-glycine peptidase domain